MTRKLIDEHELWGLKPNVKNNQMEITSQKLMVDLSEDEQL